MRVSRKLGLLLLAASLWMLQLGCGDEYRPVANPIVTPGGQPQNDHFAWVVNFNPNGQGTTTEIDVSGDSNLAVNSFGLGTITEAFPPNSLALFVASRDNDTASEYLPTLSGPITTITLLPGSRPVYLNSAQSGMMFVVNSGANSACPTTGSVSTIPLATLAVSNTVCVGMNPTLMAQSSVNFYIFVLNQGDGTVSVINNGAVVGLVTPQSGLGQNPSNVVASSDGNYMFIVTQGDGVNPGTLDILPAGSATVAATVPLGVRPTFALADPVLNRLYVANSGDNTVSVFDTSNLNLSGTPPLPLLATVPVGTNPIAVTALADGSRFYVANAGSDDVTVVSANSFSPLTTVPLPSGANPVFIASDPTSSKVYVADPGTSQTTIIQTSNNAVAQNLAAPPQNPSCTSSCVLQQPVMIVAR
ncbi:MAG TPA: YncE family protein [Candidatus Bathyarchaeia archaeon]|nr:YncE family protein [Candidatus Bathyarchaeia archaeon]